jgi:hypothetical protein
MGLPCGKEQAEKLRAAGRAARWPHLEGNRPAEKKDDETKSDFIIFFAQMPFAGASSANSARS